jgi:hypothetical protein
VLPYSIFRPKKRSSPSKRKIVEVTPTSPPPKLEDPFTESVIAFMCEFNEETETIFE